MANETEQASASTVCGTKGLDVSVTESGSGRNGRALKIKISAPIEAFRVADILAEFEQYPTFRDFVARETVAACERFFEGANGLIKSIAAPAPKSKPNQSK